MRDLSTSIRIRAGVDGLSDIKALAEHFAKAGVNTDELSDALQNLQDNWSELSTVEQSEQLASLSEEVESLQQLASDRIALGLDIAPNIQEEIEALTRAYERLRESGTLTEEELARATQNHERSVQELEDALQDAAPSIQDITSAFGEMVSAASGLSYVAKEAMQFEEAMAQVNKVVDGTPAQMSALADKVQTLAVSLGKTTDEIANIAAMGGQLGVPLEELEAFTEMAGRMSAAFNITAEEAADAAAKLSNVFALPI